MPAYSMIVSWSEDDQCYLVSVPDLPGCMSDGATPDEAVDNVKKVIAEWIDTARELGRAITEPTFHQSFTCYPQIKEIKKARKPVFIQLSCFFTHLTANLF